MLKKMMIILMCVVMLTFTSLIVPYKEQKADAATFAIAGTAVSATAVYILSALAVASIATAVGIEYGDEINAHARQLWEGASSTIKEAFASALSLAGNGSVALTGTVKEWFKNAASTIASAKYLSVNRSEVITTDSNTSTSGLNNNYNTIAYEKKFTWDMLTNQYIIVRSKDGAIHSFSGMSVRMRGTGLIELNNVYSDGSLGKELGLLAKGSTSGSETLSTSHLTSDQKNAILFAFRRSTSLQEVINVVNRVAENPLSVITASALNAYYVDVYNGIDAVFGTGTLGVKLPSDDLYLPHTNAGQTLTQGADGTLTLPSGEVYVGDVTWGLPNTVVLDLDGVRVPVLPLVDMPGYYVDVFTGQILSLSPDAPIDGVSVPPAVVVPPSQIQKPSGPDVATKKLDLTPLRMAGEKIKNKFPFSIPFDFTKQIAVFDVSPSTPKISINKPDFVSIGGRSIPLNFEINFAMFDDLAAATRWILIIAFDIGLILMIRRLMPE